MIWGTVEDPTEKVTINKINVYLEWNFPHASMNLIVQQHNAITVSTTAAGNQIDMTEVDDNEYEISCFAGETRSQLIHTIYMSTYPPLCPQVDKGTTLYINLNYDITSPTNGNFYVNGYKAIQSGDNPFTDWTSTNLSTPIHAQISGQGKSVYLRRDNTNSSAKIVPKNGNMSDALNVYIKVGNS